jgi:hypothetical protein
MLEKLKQIVEITMLSRLKTLLNCAAKATTQTSAVMQEFPEAQSILISQSNASNAPPSAPPTHFENLESAIEQAKHVKQHCR